MKIIRLGRSCFLVVFLLFGLTGILCAAERCSTMISELSISLKWSSLRQINRGAFERFTTLKIAGKGGRITPESYSLEFSRPVHLSRLEFDDALRVGLLVRKDGDFYHIAP